MTILFEASHDPMMRYGTWGSVGLLLERSGPLTGFILRKMPLAQLNDRGRNLRSKVAKEVGVYR